MLKIGIITPFSNEFPFMQRDFVEGLKLAFKGDDALQFVHAETERGLPNEVSPLFRQLIIKQEVNLIVAFLDVSALSAIKELINQTKTPTILAGMGVRLPCSAEQSSPFVFHNSFRMWESCWLAGKIAAQEIGPRIGLFASFFDSGYPLTYAHLHGAAQSGGAPAFFSITHRDKSEQELLEAQEKLQQIPSDYYFTAYYGKERSFMLNWVQEQGISTERIVPSPGIGPNEAVSSVTSWHRDINSPQNAAFIKDLLTSTGHQANEFSMLGYENGLLIREALQATYTTFDALAFVERLKVTQFVGPRGRVTVNARTQAFCSDAYRVEVDALADVSVITPVIYPKDEMELEIESNQQSNLIGWQNCYLCK